MRRLRLTQTQNECAEDDRSRCGGIMCAVWVDHSGPTLPFSGAEFIKGIVDLRMNPTQIGPVHIAPLKVINQIPNEFTAHSRSGTCR